MMKRRANEVPEWAEVKSLWLELAVPEVEIADLDPANIPSWFAGRWLLRDGSGSIYSSNPQDDTARHLCSWLPRESADVQIAFRLCAFTVAAEATSLAAGLVELAREKMGLHDLWWRNAKHVLPYIEESRADRDDRGSLWREDWRHLVKDAAWQWSAIASRYVLLKHPQDHAVGSPEHDAYHDAYMDKLRRLCVPQRTRRAAQGEV